MNKKRRTLIAVILLFGVLGIYYPFFILGYTWFHVIKSDFQGGRLGPLDAYRHTLASALVAYTLNEEVVALVTCVMEPRNEDPDLMDRHNNRIGARIGSSVEAFSDIEPTVRKSVLSGTVNSADEGQVTWLPAERWVDGWAW